MTDKIPPLSPSFDAAAPDEHRGTAATAQALDEAWRDYATACTILEHVELMIDLADSAQLSDHARTILEQAKVEAERVIRDSGIRTLSTKRH